MRFWAEILDRCVRDRDELGLEDQLVDVAFGDLVRDPMRVVRHIYEKFSLDLEPGVIDRMQVFLEENKRHSHGVHSYTLEQFGLTQSMIEDRFGNYIERFITGKE